MAIQMEVIKQAQAVFYYLLQHHELLEEQAPDLHKAYMEQDEVQEIVKSQAEIANCHIEAFSGVVYLIPKEENYFLGYSKAQLKKELCKSNPTDKDYYLAQFAILVLVLAAAAKRGTLFVLVNCKILLLRSSRRVRPNSRRTSSPSRGCLLLP